MSPRITSIQEIIYEVKFLTPAFLGNAEQSGQWRTPPFKALLRQWWRVVVAGEVRYDWKLLREREGRLFGHAWLQNDCDIKRRKISARASKVRIKLDTWDKGDLREWNYEPNVYHGEVGRGGRNVGAHLYLGYGPLAYKRNTKKTNLKDDSVAIRAGACNTLRLAWPEDEDTLADAAQLIHRFGTIGGRSRNGWGSFELRDQNDSTNSFDASRPLIRDIARPLDDCLKLSWPHALGLSDDGQPLIWYTKDAHQRWEDAMKDLAKIKIKFRTEFKFTRGNEGRFEGRHLIAYPVTNHNVLGNNTRIANQLRFKVIRDNGQYRGLAYHLPCAIPPNIITNDKKIDRRWNDPKNQKKVWEQVHQTLDRQMERTNAR